MTEATEILPGFPAVRGKPVHVAFDGGRLTSDAGILLLAAVERRLRIAERLAGCLEDPRDPDRVRHELAEMIRYRALLIAAGYPDGNDCDALESGSSAISVQVDERCGSNAHIGRIRLSFCDPSCFHARCYRWSRLA